MLYTTAKIQVKVETTLLKQLYLASFPVSSPATCLPCRGAINPLHVRPVHTADIALFLTHITVHTLIFLEATKTAGCEARNNARGSIEGNLHAILTCAKLTYLLAYCILDPANFECKVHKNCAVVSCTNRECANLYDNYCTLYDI